MLRAVDGDTSFLCRLFPARCTDVQEFDIDLTPNQPPEVMLPGISDQHATQWIPFDLDISVHFTDPDGDELTFYANGLPPSRTIRNPTNNSASTSTSIAEEIGIDAAQSISGTISVGGAIGTAFESGVSQ